MVPVPMSMGTGIMLVWVQVNLNLPMGYPLLSLPSGSPCIFAKLTLDGLFGYHKSATVVEECKSGMHYLSV